MKIMKYLKKGNQMPVNSDSAAHRVLCALSGAMVFFKNFVSFMVKSSCLRMENGFSYFSACSA